MEPVGLAVGVIGFFGLFNTCLDAVNKYESWKDFGSESQSLTALCEAQKLRLEKWGEAVGVDHESLSSKHHRLLDDPRTRSSIQNLLFAIKDTCGDENVSPSTITSGAEIDTFEGRVLTKHDHSLILHESKRQRLKWALRGKERRIAQVAQFSSLVDALHSLVPISGDIGDESKYIETGGKLGVEGAWATELKKLIAKIEHDNEVETRRHIQLWLLGDLSPNERYETYVERRVKGSCQWVLDRPWFLKWASSNFPYSRAKFLWINGPAGFGKSVLCAKITEHLLLTLNTPTAHFFFSADVERRDPFLAMRLWLSQLLFHPEAFRFVRGKWETAQGQTAARMDILSLLQEIVSAIPGCTFILDGLDECDWAKGTWPGNSDDSITSFLRTLRRTITGTSTRIMIISRDEPEIRHGLSNEGPYDPVVEHRITPEDVQTDVMAYSRSIVEEKLSTKADEAKDDIIKRLAARCHGQFLWIRLQRDTLRSGKSQKKLEQAINSTPSGIEHIYERNWIKIMRLANEDKTRAFSLLRWTAFSLRPLTIGEISGALVISEHDDELLLDELPDSIDEDYVNTEIVDLCGSLLEVRDPPGKRDARFKTVHLAHFSVKEYLLRNIPTEGSALQLNAVFSSSTEVIESTILAKKCLRFVNSQEAWLKISGVQDEVLSAFRRYAAGSWYQHAKLGDMSDAKLVSSITTLFDPSNPNWASWKAWFDLNDTKAKERNTTCGVATAGPLYYAAWLGLTNIVEFLIHKFKSNVNDGGYNGESLLGVASGEGNIEPVRTLLEQGADVTMTDINGRTPLYFASHNGHTEVVRLLIESSANFNTPNNTGWTPLNVACVQGHIELIKLLLDRGADPIADSDGWNAATAASANGHTEVVELLIMRDTDIKSPSGHGGTPIGAACNNGFIDTVELLLKHGADINIANAHGWTPLSSAADSGHTRIVEMLLKHGADTSTATNNGITPLYIASFHGNIEIVKLLLDWGADTENVSSKGNTSLSVSSFQGHTAVVKLLVTSGADIATRDNSGKTPLISASANGHVEIVKLLLEHGASTEVKDTQGYTPLLWASIYGYADIVKLLLQQGANTEVKDNAGYTPLLWASINGYVEVVKLFLQEDINIGVKDAIGFTPLMWASREGYSEVVKLLLEHSADAAVASSSGHAEVPELLPQTSADLTSVDITGNTPLHIAAFGGHLEVVEILLRISGIHVDALDRWNRTPLFYAAARGHLDVIDTLLLNNANANIKDHYRSTPLFVAVRNGHKHVAERLITLAEYPIHFRDDLGRTLLWWAARCGDADIIELICRWAKEHNVEFNESDLQVEGFLAEPSETLRHCDACFRFLSVNKAYYMCKTCWNLDICCECFYLGARCLNLSHEWTIHQLEG